MSTSSSIFQNGVHPMLAHTILGALDWRSLLTMSATCRYLNALVAETAALQLVLAEAYFVVTTAPPPGTSSVDAVARLREIQTNWSSLRPKAGTVLNLDRGEVVRIVADGGYLAVLWGNLGDEQRSVGGDGPGLPDSTRYSGAAPSEWSVYDLRRVRDGGEITARHYAYHFRPGVPVTDIAVCAADGVLAAVVLTTGSDPAKGVATVVAFELDPADDGGGCDNLAAPTSHWAAPQKGVEFAFKLPSELHGRDLPVHTTPEGWGWVRDSGDEFKRLWAQPAACTFASVTLGAGGVAVVQVPVGQSAVVGLVDWRKGGVLLQTQSRPNHVHTAAVPLGPDTLLTGGVGADDEGEALPRADRLALFTPWRSTSAADEWYTNNPVLATTLPATADELGAFAPFFDATSGSPVSRYTWSLAGDSHAQLFAPMALWTSEEGSEEDSDGEWEYVISNVYTTCLSGARLRALLAKSERDPDSASGGVEHLLKPAVLDVLPETYRQARVTGLRAVYLEILRQERQLEIILSDYGPQASAHPMSFGAPGTCEPPQVQHDHPVAANTLEFDGYTLGEPQPRPASGNPGRHQGATLQIPAGCPLGIEAALIVGPEHLIVSPTSLGRPGPLTGVGPGTWMRWGQNKGMSVPVLVMAF